MSSGARLSSIALASEEARGRGWLRSPILILKCPLDLFNLNPFYTQQRILFFSQKHSPSADTC